LSSSRWFHQRKRFLDRLLRGVGAVGTLDDLARCGILVNVTPFEPEWEGHVTMSISNTGPAPVRIYAGEGIAQLIFLSADEECQISYGDRKGKYQAQKGIVLSRVEPGGSSERE